ncbi:MAG: contact-dependent growth inhibition system immunity protein [Burkholderiales bacterium]
MKRQSKFDNATLEELERSNWGEPTYQSHLVTECHRLRRVQLRLLTLEDLRILIGQSIGLQFLVPLAVKQLQRNPLAEGDFFPGDLLCALLRVEPEFWEGHTDARNQVAAISERARELAAPEGKVVVRALEEALSVFSHGGSGGGRRIAPSCGVSRRRASSRSRS